MVCSVCGKDTKNAEALKNIGEVAVCDDCAAYFDFNDKTISSDERCEFFSNNYGKIKNYPALKGIVDKWLSEIDIPVERSKSKVKADSSKTGYEKKNEPLYTKNISNSATAGRTESVAVFDEYAESSSLKNTAGPKIEGAVDLLWNINLILVIVSVVASTIAFPGVLWSQSFKDYVIAFLISGVIGCFELLLAYVIKLVLKGFAQQVSDTRVIKEILKK